MSLLHIKDLRHWLCLCAVTISSFSVLQAKEPGKYPLAGTDESTPSLSHYFSWIDNTNEGSTEKQTLANLDFFKWLHDDYGMDLDIYALDAGAIDTPGGYGSMDSERFKKQFPNGFGPPAADRSWPSLPDLDLIASQTRLIILNSRKFTAAGFLQSLLSSVATGLASLNQIASDLKDRDHPGMARQSLHQRFDIRSTAFLMTVLGDLMEQRYSTAATAIGSSGIQRILIEDASSQVMPKSNADAFPAHGNHYGKTAGVKIDLAYDLLTGSIISHGLHAATEQDKTIGKEFVIEVRRGDLVLRDMGYFSLSEFTAISVAS